MAKNVTLVRPADTKALIEADTNVLICVCVCVWMLMYFARYNIALPMAAAKAETNLANSDAFPLKYFLPKDT